MGRVRLGQANGDEASPPGPQRLRQVQAVQGKERAQQDPRQSCQHQEEQTLESRKIVKMCLSSNLSTFKPSANKNMS